MNRLSIELLVAIIIAGIAASYGDHVGTQNERAKHLTLEAAIAATREAAQQGAAEEISKIKVTNTTVRGEVQHEIQTNTVYRDCKLPADGLRIANEAITGNRTQPAGGGKLPSADPAGK